MRATVKRKPVICALMSGAVGKVLTSDGTVVLFSPEDYELAASCNWQLSGYPGNQHVTNTPKKRMARLIMKAGRGLEVDHINGNTFDNRRENLRVCSKQNNCLNKPMYKCNTTGAKGVNIRPSGRYEARIQCNKKSLCLGTYDTVAEASAVYEAKARELFGEFNRVNPRNPKEVG